MLAKGEQGTALWCYDSNGRQAANAAASSCLTCGVRQLGLCAALDDRQIRQFEQITVSKKLETGQLLVTEGDPSDFAYNVISGMLKLYKSLPDGRRQITGFLLPGDFLGLPSRRTHTYSAEAVVATSLCRFPRGPLEQLFDKTPDLERRFLAIVKDELTAAQDHMLLLGRRAARERVACFLLEFSNRAKRLGWSVNPLILPMHRSDIADYLGLTVETVSRTLTALKRDGVVSLPKSDEIMILRRDLLEDLCAG